MTKFNVIVVASALFVAVGFGAYAVVTSQPALAGNGWPSACLLFLGALVDTIVRKVRLGGGA